MELLLIFVLIIFGLVGLISPEITWKMEYGWRFKDAEPSELALLVNQIVGGLMIVIGIIIFIFLISS